ncbi:MAG: hypothetical protein IPK61_13085 [Saprospiraceae bacterium]|nr:hypothetical protein [Saprospiraceae bacterium]
MQKKLSPPTGLKKASFEMGLGSSSVEKHHFDPDSCPCCKSGKMIWILSFSSVQPPIANLQIFKCNAQ